MFNQPIPAVTKNLLIINGLFFLAKFALGAQGIDLDAHLAAFYPESPLFHGWQIITHMFMHANFMHILFNMFALWMFGSVVEHNIGSQRFLILYFVAGLGSFTLFNFVNYLQVEQLKSIISAAEISSTQEVNVIKATQELFSYYTTPMLGASGAIYGLLVAFAVLFPNAQLALLFFPVPVKAKYFIPVLMAMEFFMGIQNYSWDPFAHFAHLGGAVIGFLLVRAWKKELHRNW